MRTRLFLRTAEFLWQEGHTAHATEAGSARRNAAHARSLPRLRRERHGHARHPRRKTPANASPARVETFSIEAMMQDGKALQIGHQPLPRPELRARLRRHLPEQGRPARTGLRHQLGRLHAPGRRADHDPLRRHRPGAAAEARPHPGRHRADLQERRRENARPRRSRQGRRRTQGAGACRQTRRPRRHRARREVLRLGSQRRAAAHRDRPEGPGERQPLPGAPLRAGESQARPNRPAQTPQEVSCRAPKRSRRSSRRSPRCSASCSNAPASSAPNARRVINTLEEFESSSRKKAAGSPGSTGPATHEHEDEMAKRFETSIRCIPFPDQIPDEAKGEGKCILTGAAVHASASSWPGRIEKTMWEHPSGRDDPGRSRAEAHSYRSTCQSLSF